MPDWNTVTRAHVLAALAEGERIGTREFLTRYGFRGLHAAQLWHRGEEFDAAAILGVAYLQATGRVATKDELPSGEDGVAQVLTRLGFDVVAQEPSIAPARTTKAAPARTTKATPARSVKATSPARSTKAAPAPTRRTKPEPTFTICPRCQMALPATGVCDNCD
jgi:hypothetical protein